MQLLAATAPNPCTGVACPTGWLCVTGACVPPPSAPFDPCAGVVCPTGSVCQTGACIPVAAPTQSPVIVPVSAVQPMARPTTDRTSTTDLAVAVATTQARAATLNAGRIAQAIAANPPQTPAEAANATLALQDAQRRAYEAQVAADNARRASAQANAFINANADTPATDDNTPQAHSQPTDAEWVSAPAGGAGQPSTFPWGKLAIGLAIAKALAFF